MESYGGRGGENAEAGNRVDGCIPGGSEDHAHTETSQAGVADGGLSSWRTDLHHYGADE